MPAGLEPLIAGAILLPLTGAVLAFLAPRLARVIGLATAVIVAADAAAVAARIAAVGQVRLAIGGWAAPLGITLAADGLSAFMLATAAVAGLAAMLYAARYFRGAPATANAFIPLALMLSAGLNALFLSGDVFNLYVTLELVGLAAAGLVAVAGGTAALAGAMRYLLVTLVASLTYLLGVGLLYHSAGTLDIVGLGASLVPGPSTRIALCLMAAAMLLKSGLFPLHFWLPPAHSSAPAPVSALLSALVVKASLYLLLRLWIDVAPSRTPLLGDAIGMLGAAAVLFGSIQALRQDRLKLLVAYSTVSQLGYLFIPFALDSAAAVGAWRGGLYLVLCHALAKTAMFLAVGNIQIFGGDRISQLDHVVQRLPITMAAFAMAGITLAGLPPSGGFIAKWLILEGLVAEERWGLASVVVVGGLLAAIYVFRVVGPAFTKGELARPAQRVPRSMEAVAFGLALATIVLGFTAPAVLRLLDAGVPLGPLAEGVH